MTATWYQLQKLGGGKCKLFHPEDVRMLRITSLTLTCYNHTCFLLYFSLICFILQVRFKDSEDSTKEIAALIKGRYKDQSGMCEWPCSWNEVLKTKKTLSLSCYQETTECKLLSPKDIWKLSYCFTSKLCTGDFFHKWHTVLAQI